MTRNIIETDKAPQAIGSYSQAVQVGDFLFASGQIALDTKTGEMNNESFEAEVHQVFTNLRGIAEAASVNFSDAVKLTVYITDLSDYAVLNQVMGEYFDEPFPARAAVQVAALPKAAKVEVDAIFISKVS